MINKQTAKEIALSCGFKLKEQANGEMDLNPSPCRLLKGLF